MFRLLVEQSVWTLHQLVLLKAVVVTEVAVEEAVSVVDVETVEVVVSEAVEIAVVVVSEDVVAIVVVEAEVVSPTDLRERQDGYPGPWVTRVCKPCGRCVPILCKARGISSPASLKGGPSEGSFGSAKPFPRW